MFVFEFFFKRHFLSKNQFINFQYWDKRETEFDADFQFTDTFMCKNQCCGSCSHKFHKIQNYFIFEMLKKIIWANFQRIIELFTQNNVNKLPKIWVWDPGSGKNLFRIPDPGIKKAPDPRSGSATLVKIG